MYLYFEKDPIPLFTNNETNNEKLFETKNGSDYVKDAFHEAVVHQKIDAVNPELKGTKSALHYYSQDKDFAGNPPPTLQSTARTNPLPILISYLPHENPKPTPFIKRSHQERRTSEDSKASLGGTSVE